MDDDYGRSDSESENDQNFVEENEDYDSDDDDDEENDDDNGDYSIEYDDNAGYGSGDGDVPDNAQNYEEHSFNTKELNGSYGKKGSLATTQPPPMIGKPSNQSTNNNSRNAESKRNASYSEKTNREDKYHLEVECAQNNADTEMGKNSDFFAPINDKYGKERIQGVSPGCSESICSDKEDQKVGYSYRLHNTNQSN